MGDKTYEKQMTRALRGVIFEGGRILPDQGLHPDHYAGTPNHDGLGRLVFYVGQPDAPASRRALIDFFDKQYAFGHCTSQGNDECFSTSHMGWHYIYAVGAWYFGVLRNHQDVVDKALRWLRGEVSSCRECMTPWGAIVMPGPRCHIPDEHGELVQADQRVIRNKTISYMIKGGGSLNKSQRSSLDWTALAILAHMKERGIVHDISSYFPAKPVLLAKTRATFSVLKRPDRWVMQWKGNLRPMLRPCVWATVNLKTREEVYGGCNPEWGKFTRIDSPDQAPLMPDFGNAGPSVEMEWPQAV